MSNIIPIDAVPNQSLSVQLGDIRYDIRLRDIVNMMAVDIAINDIVILEGHRVVGGLPLIPYKYLEGLGGNFTFLTELGDIVYWGQFGITQSLFYFTAEELEAIRAN